MPAPPPLSEPAMVSATGHVLRFGMTPLKPEWQLVDSDKNRR